MNEIDKVSIVQHSIEAIDSYQNDISEIYKFIGRLYEEIDKKTQSARGEGAVIKILLRDKKFKDSLCPDFVSKAERYMTKF